MSLTFKPRKYVCLDCDYKGKTIASFSSLQNVVENFPLEKILPAIENPENNQILYEQILERDDFGLIIKREAVRSKCEKCSSINIEAIKLDNEENVLNFYPSSTSEKWLTNFGKV